MDDIPRRKLRYIITKYGRPICDDPKRCEGLLRDLCPGYRREVHILISALKEHVVSDLLALAKTTPQAVLLEKLTDRLYDNLGIAREFGRWAVVSWALVLGLFPRRTTASDDAPPASGTGGPRFIHRRIKLRIRSLTVSERDARRAFHLSDGWRPVRYVLNDFHGDGATVVSDRMTRLVWQHAGSGFLPYEAIHRYMQEANRNRVAGFSDWRLPTLEELASLLEPSPQANKLFLSTWFDARQAWCWSSDLRSAGGAWTVDFEEGRIRWNCLTCFVKLVRSV